LAYQETGNVTTILLADDHAVVRQGLGALLEDEPDFTVVGEAASGLEAVQLCNELKPDILVLDIMMEDVSGIEVARQVKENCPHTAIVVLSMYGDKKHVLEALRAGAKAYVVKKSVSSELVQAVREALVGRRYLGASLADVVVDAYLEKAESGPADPYDLLSNREREVLHLAAHGYTNAEIAKRLCISRRTVETHRTNAMRKLNLSNQTNLLRYALQRGILPPDS
jgi:two-component system response regulator NreC